MTGAYVVLCVGARLTLARDSHGRPVASAYPFLMAFLAFLLERHGLGRALLLPAASLDSFLILNGLDEDHLAKAVLIVEDETERPEDAIALLEGLAPRVAAACTA